MLPLLAITVLGAALRVYGLDSDLWIDELATLNAGRGAPIFDMFLPRPSNNQHPLNSALINVCISLFGEHAWSVRLPALAFGVASVPAMYWLTRCCRFSRVLSLGAALLLAVSYQHLSFSQSARGYTGYVLFSIVATACLVRLLERPRFGLALGYAVAMGLNFVALLQSAFLFAAHVIVVAAALLIARGKAEHVPGRIRTLGVALGAAATLAALTFSPMLATITRSLNRTFGPRQTTAFDPLSVAFIRETVNGLAAGVGSGPLLAGGVLIAAGTLGLWTLARRAWVAPVAIVLSQLIFLATTVLMGWRIYPRFFILCLPLGLLAVLSTFEQLGRGAQRVGPRRVANAGPSIAAALVGLVVLASLAVLPRYYRTPKQSNRAATEEIGRRIGPTGTAVAVGVADTGFNYYAPRLGLPIDRTYSARTLAAFEAIAAKRPPKEIWVLTTFQHALEIEEPGLAAAVAAGWDRAQVFPAAVNGAEIILWQPKP